MRYLASLFVLAALALPARAGWFEPLCPCPSACHCLAGSCTCGQNAAQKKCCEGCSCGVAVVIRWHPRPHKRYHKSHHKACPKCQQAKPAKVPAKVAPKLEVIEEPRR